MLVVQRVPAKLPLIAEQGKFMYPTRRQAADKRYDSPLIALLIDANPRQTIRLGARKGLAMP